MKINLLDFGPGLLFGTGVIVNSESIEEAEVNEPHPDKVDCDNDDEDLDDFEAEEESSIVTTFFGVHFFAGLTVGFCAVFELDRVL